MRLGCLKAIVMFISIIQWLGYLATLICIFIELEDDRDIYIKAYILTFCFIALIFYPYGIIMFSKNRLHYNTFMFGCLCFGIMSCAASFSATWIRFGHYNYQYWVTSIQNFVAAWLNFFLIGLLYHYRDDIVVVNVVPSNNLTTTSMHHVREGSATNNHPEHDSKIVV